MPAFGKAEMPPSERADFVAEGILATSAADRARLAVILQVSGKAISEQDIGYCHGIAAVDADCHDPGADRRINRCVKAIGLELDADSSDAKRLEIELVGAGDEIGGMAIPRNNGAGTSLQDDVPCQSPAGRRVDARLTVNKGPGPAAAARRIGLDRRHRILYSGSPVA